MAALTWLRVAAWHLRNKHPDVALGLAQLEVELANVDAAQALVQALETDRHELHPEAVALLDSLEGALKQTTAT
jgi:thioredoxin-like negative regulator of GroEL